MSNEIWKEEYRRLSELFHRLEDKGLHESAELVADKLSDMELTAPFTPNDEARIMATFATEEEN